MPNCPSEQRDESVWIADFPCEIFPVLPLQTTVYGHVICFVNYGGKLSQSALGTLLRTLRDERKLSLREMSQLSEVDHAYIYRLETGEKESPSNEMVGKLARALKASKLESDMLKYLAEHPQTDPALIVYAMGDPTIEFDEFTTLAGAVFRGSHDYAAVLKIIRRARKEAEGKK